MKTSYVKVREIEDHDTKFKFITMRFKKKILCGCAVQKL